jgi:hypothetical protein
MSTSPRKRGEVKRKRTAFPSRLKGRTDEATSLFVMAGFIPAIPLRDAPDPPHRDHRDIGERSDAVLRTAMPGDDNYRNSALLLIPRSALLRA